MKKCIINTNKAPKAIGPYSQAIVLKGQGLMFTSGQIPIDPDTGEIISTDIQSQTRQVLENLKAVLKAADCGLENVVKTTVFLKHMDDFSAMNEIYAQYFSINPPVRSTVEVARLPRDVRVEIDCIAEVDINVNQ